MHWTFTTLIALSAVAGAAVTASAQVAQDVTYGTVVVRIDGFRNATGQARVAVFDQERGFPDRDANALRGIVVAIADGRAEVRFDSLPYGDYAVAMFHDENADGKLNKKLFGIPKEGYGVSNNVIHGMRSPRFAEALFRLDATPKVVEIHVHY